MAAAESVVALPVMLPEPAMASAAVSVSTTDACPSTAPLTVSAVLLFSVSPAAVRSASVAMLLLPVSDALPPADRPSVPATMLPVSIIDPDEVKVALAEVTLPGMSMVAAVRLRLAVPTTGPATVSGDPSSRVSEAALKDPSVDIASDPVSEAPAATLPASSPVMIVPVLEKLPPVVT
jgi:hypothetical protein